MSARTVSRVIPILACVAAFATLRAADFPFFEPVQPPRPFQIMAHRGEANQAPGNTRAALERCIEDGLEWAEVDVRLTRDRQHVLAHDAAVTDAAGKMWTIREHPWAELRGLDVGARFAERFAGERLLPVKECFTLCKGRLNLCFDCKAADLEQLAREILNAGMERQVVIYADLDQLRPAQRVTENKIAMMAKWRPACGGAEWAVSNRLAAVEIDAPDLTSDVTRSFKRAGIKVQAKTLGEWDAPGFWDRAIAAGADWLQTDVPEEVLAHAVWRRLKQWPVQISLHRGAGRYAPENTLPAFEKAIRLHADFVEFDVRATMDGTFHLLHDSRLDRTTDGRGPIDQISHDGVRQLSAGVKFGRPFAAARVPSLDEFLGAMAGPVGLYLDAKAIPPEALVEVLQRHGVVERTVVYQTPPYLQRLKALYPNVRRLTPLGRPEDFDQLAAMLKPYAVDADWDILSRDLIARCHAAGVRVFADALGEHERVEDYLRAMEWGIDLIQTDHPLRVLRAIELWERGRSDSPSASSPEAGRR